LRGGATTVDQRELLRRVRHIEILTDRLSDDFFAGVYLSAFRGVGLEFSEVREYAPGDDIRTIDWNVTARTGKPHVKRFVEERELTVMLVVDASGSVDFGSRERTKAEAAAEACALLAFSAIKSNDRVGLAVFTDEVELFLPPRKGRHQVLRVIREVLGFERRSLRTNIATAVEFVTRALTRRSVIFVLSDFRDRGFEQSLALARRRHDVVAVRIHDPREEALPPVGLLELEDAETGRHLVVDASSPHVRERHHLSAQRGTEELARSLRSRKVDLVSVSTSGSAADPLVEFFARRRRRLRR
jgi:uncharacterized protein (DUF58 family)